MLDFYVSGVVTMKRNGRLVSKILPRCHHISLLALSIAHRGAEGGWNVTASLGTMILWMISTVKIDTPAYFLSSRDRARRG